jgi:hypothetical protein
MSPRQSNRPTSPPVESEGFARLDSRLLNVAPGTSGAQALTLPLPKIFIYDLPAKFNREMVKKYKVCARWVYMRGHWIRSAGRVGRLG